MAHPVRPQWNEGICHCTVSLIFEKPPTFWIASALRGSIGRYIRLSCPLTSCKGCPEEQRNQCPYYILYEKKEKGGALKPLLLSIPPPPHILHGIVPPAIAGWKDNGTRLEFKVTLLMPRLLIPWISALVRAGIEGINGIKYRVEWIKDHTGNIVFDGERYNMPAPIDIWRRKLPEMDELLYVQYTPYYKYLPIPLEELAADIRRRLILLINNYGNKGRIADIIVKSHLATYAVKGFRLRRKSSRSKKTMFNAAIGIMRFDDIVMDDATRWILSLSDIIGGGGNASFGFGFAKIMQKQDLLYYHDEI